MTTMHPKPRVLLVDDSEATVDGLKSFLDQKYEVFTASNGLECLRVLEANEK
jgi:PleD family two-component response regulator